MVVVLKGIKKDSLALCLMQDGVGERCEELQLLLQIVPQGGWMHSLKLGMHCMEPKKKCFLLLIIRALFTFSTLFVAC